MKSENRFLTTHVGSLPRPDDLIEIMFAREDGVPIDRVALAERIELAVDDAGVDPDVVWAKLGVLARGAQLASRKFWPGR
jgi:methionine synthase II (cobalamin-independent)